MVFIRMLVNVHSMLSAEVGQVTGVVDAAMPHVEAPSRAVMRSFFLQFVGDPHASHGGEHVQVKLIREEDRQHWCVFFTVFFALLIFDNWVLNRSGEKISFGKAVLYTIFFILCALAFNVYVYFARGADDAFQWGTGYLLEWMLSVDNLFVFHRVFQIFRTPDNQKHRPLFLGIIGAIVFRMAFFCVEELLMHHVSWIHIVFGLFLIYTGVQAVTMDDDDDPTEGSFFKMVESRIPYINRYTTDARFFVQVPVDPGTRQLVVLEDEKAAHVAAAGGDAKVVFEWRATRLLIVVICLEVTDVVFAVDSVSAIVAQIPDLFLAYTACVFAMLGLRATFFVIDELVKIFSLLSYGVAAILVFLGIKLILRGYVHIEPLVFLCILVFTLATSIIASIIKERYWPDEGEEGSDDEASVSLDLLDVTAAGQVTPHASLSLEPKEFGGETCA